MSRQDDLERIRGALDRAREILERFTPGEVAHRRKAGGDPLTEADTAVNDELRSCLPREGEGWLSEETVDRPDRLDCERVWIVDPLDGTREFVEGIPEWCVSIGLVENGRAVAGGICNPVADHTVIGSIETGVTLNGAACRARSGSELAGREILASRSETKRGEWDRFAGSPFHVRPMGSVAYKLALVAAGLTDATWTLVPKNEWDVAAGAALVRASGGEIWLPDGSEPRFNRPDTRLPGFIAAPADLAGPIRRVLREASASG